MRIHFGHLQLFRNLSQVASCIMTIPMQVTRPNILPGPRKPCCAFCDNPIHAYLIRTAGSPAQLFSPTRRQKRVGCRNEMGTDTGFGRPDFWPGEPVQAPAGRSKPAGRQDMGTDTMSDVPQERLTSNVQLSTFNVVTERADDGRDMGTDTEFGRPGF